MGDVVLPGEALPGGGIVWLLKRISGVDGRRRGTADRPGRARPVLLRSAPAGLLGLEPHLDDRLVELVADRDEGLDLAALGLLEALAVLDRQDRKSVV